MDGPLDGKIYERIADSQTIREHRIFSTWFVSHIFFSIEAPPSRFRIADTFLCILSSQIFGKSFIYLPTPPFSVIVFSLARFESMLEIPWNFTERLFSFVPAYLQEKW